MPCFDLVVGQRSREELWFILPVLMSGGTDFLPGHSSEPFPLPRRTLHSLPSHTWKAQLVHTRSVTKSKLILSGSRTPSLLSQSKVCVHRLAWPWVDTATLYFLRARKQGGKGTTTFRSLSTPPPVSEQLASTCYTVSHWHPPFFVPPPSPQVLSAHQNLQLSGSWEVSSCGPNVLPKP